MQLKCVVLAVIMCTYYRLAQILIIRHEHIFAALNSLIDELISRAEW